MFGIENQRCAMRSNASGVHRLTTPMNASTPSSSDFAWRARAFATAPSVFITSQVAPSSA